jgi:hypothetical protein
MPSRQTSCDPKQLQYIPRILADAYTGANFTQDCGLLVENNISIWYFVKRYSRSKSTRPATGDSDFNRSSRMTDSHNIAKKYMEIEYFLPRKRLVEVLETFPLDIWRQRSQE